jgi:hypothetical protein
MNKLPLIALAALVTSFAAHAAEPVAAPIKPLPTAAAAAVGGPQKTAAISQQDKMRNCNKQATGKKGAERKAFMKTCLSHKA